MSTKQPTLQFIYTKLFERTAQGLLTDDEMRAVELELLENPRAGAVEAGTGGVRKIRAAIRGRGKSGGARVVYFYIEMRAKIYFLFAFPKSGQASLTNEQRKLLRELTRQLEEIG